jgi:hypothetical protein
MPEVGPADPIRVDRNHPARDGFAPEPTILVEFPDLVDLHRLDRKVRRQLPESFGQIERSATGHGV